MSKEYTYRDLFEGEKFGLDSAIRDDIDYVAFARIRTLLLLSHDQINKLEARIAELESKMNFLVKSKQVDEEPIEVFIERAIAHDMEVLFSGKPVDELSETQKELRKILLNTWVTAKPDEFTREHDNLPVHVSPVALDHLKRNGNYTDGYVPQHELKGRTRTAREHLYGDKVLKAGYVPDDFRD